MTYRLYRLAADDLAGAEDRAVHCGARGLLRAQNLLAEHPAIEPWRIHSFVHHLNRGRCDWDGQHHLFKGGLLIVRTDKHR